MRNIVFYKKKIIKNNSPYPIPLMLFSVWVLTMMAASYGFTVSCILMNNGPSMSKCRGPIFY